MQVTTISDQLFFSTVKIETQSQKGTGAGTGFFFLLPDGDDGGYSFIVTNKHVVNGTSSGALTFIPDCDGKPSLGRGLRMNVPTEVWSKLWFGHQDPAVDIAVCPLKLILDQCEEQFGCSVFHRQIDARTIPSPEVEVSFDSIETVTFVGYPDGLWDTKNFLPIARRGTTASPLPIDFEGKPQFLIDASVFRGSSGSPVFIATDGQYTNRDGSISFGRRFHFLGVVASVYARTEHKQIVARPIPTVQGPFVEHEEMLDIGVVFKARTVEEAARAALLADGVVLANSSPAPEPV
jgi:hypothetical protein